MTLFESRLRNIKTHHEIFIFTALFNSLRSMLGEGFIVDDLLKLLTRSEIVDCEFR